MKTNYYASNPRGSSAPNLSIEELLDAQPLSVRQLAIVALCGMPLSIATVVVGAFQTGGTLGAPTLGYFMDRRRPETVLAGAYFLGASFIALLGFVIGSKIGLAICIFLAGAWLFSRGLGLQAAFVLTALPLWQSRPRSRFAAAFIL